MSEQRGTLGPGTRSRAKENPLAEQREEGPGKWLCLPVRTRAPQSFLLLTFLGSDYTGWALPSLGLHIPGGEAGEGIS